MRIDPILKLLRYPYGYHLIPRIELIEINQRRFDFIFAKQLFFSIKMIFKKWGQVQSGRSAKVNGLEIKKVDGPKG